MAATQATFAACPLALVLPSNETGRVMILANCGTFGVPDVQANRRPCPIGKDKFEPCMKAIIGARHAGNPEPAKLNDGEIYVMITPVERKAMFSRALKNPNMKTGKNKARTHVPKGRYGSSGIGRLKKVPAGYAPTVRRASSCP